MSLVTPWRIAFAAVAFYYLAVAVQWLVLRPRQVAPDPATPDLRDEPPAVVSLLTHQMKAPHAASATLLDLAARRIVELFEVAPDRVNTMVRLRQPVPSDARPYELRVLERLSRVAGTEAVSVEELRQRYAAGGDRWRRRLTQEVARDARRLGLVRSRPVGLDAVGGVVAAVATAAVIVGILQNTTPDRDDGGLGLLGLVIGGWVFGSVFGYLALTLSVLIFVSDRNHLTAEGRRVAAHWLGVAAWLRAYEPLRDLPPAAVAVWDRYLAYGAALGAMPHAVDILDLEATGHRDVVWSAQTGTPRPVYVRYQKRNRLLRPAGPASAGASRIWAVFSLALWSAVAAFAWSPPHHWLPVLIFVVALIQVARALYRLIWSIVDIYRPVTVTGTLIDISLVGQQTVTADRPGLPATMPTHYYLIVDDGSTDQLQPWIVNRDIARGEEVPGAMPMDPAGVAEYVQQVIKLGFAAGDPVYLQGQRHSRYVTALRPIG
jgi:hypothetical protein